MNSACRRLAENSISLAAPIGNRTSPYHYKWTAILGDTGDRVFGLAPSDRLMVSKTDPGGTPAVGAWSSYDISLLFGTFP